MYSSRLVEGVVVKSVGGRLSVNTENGLVVCSLRGSVNESVYVGDRVVISAGDATVERLLPRKSLLYRPVVANADYVLVVFSAKDPTPSYLLLDRILVAAEEKGITPVICINKCDLGAVDLSRYDNAGYARVFVSAETGDGFDELKTVLKDKITVLAGPSGVGKSSITARLTGESLRVSAVSSAANRGRHTTRHSEFFDLPFGGVLVDSPGFGAMDLSYIDRGDLRHFYPEFEAIEPCRFSDCMHENEPDCKVRDAVKCGIISEDRYETYLRIMEELK